MFGRCHHRRLDDLVSIIVDVVVVDVDVVDIDVVAAACARC